MTVSLENERLQLQKEIGTLNRHRHQLEYVLNDHVARCNLISYSPLGKSNNTYLNDGDGFDLEHGSVFLTSSSDESSQRNFCSMPRQKMNSFQSLTFNNEAQDLSKPARPTTTSLSPCKRKYEASVDSVKRIDYLSSGDSLSTSDISFSADFASPKSIRPVYNSVNSQMSMKTPPSNTFQTGPRGPNSDRSESLSVQGNRSMNFSQGVDDLMDAERDLKPVCYSTVDSYTSMINQSCHAKSSTVGGFTSKILMKL